VILACKLIFEIIYILKQDLLLQEIICAGVLKEETKR
jgi:hypothetical protein